MSILDFFGPKIAEPKSFDKDLFIKYYVEYHLVKISKECTNRDRDAQKYYVRDKKSGKHLFYFDNRLTYDKYWDGGETEAQTRQMLKDWLKPGKTYVHIDYSDSIIDIDSDDEYATYLARPLLYARLYPNKAISKQILSVLHAIQTVPERALKTVYEDIKQRFEEKQAKEAEEKRQAAMNILLGNTKQK